MNYIKVGSTTDYIKALSGLDTNDNVNYIATWLKDNLPCVMKGNVCGNGCRCCYNTDIGPTSFVSVCHREFSCEASSSTTFVGTLFTNNTHSDESRSYLEYITGPESPWIGVLKDAYLIVDAEDGFPYGIIFFKVNQLPIKLLTSFLIVSRMNGSWNQGQPFRWFQESGFTKPEAIFLSSFHSTSTKTASNTDHRTKKGFHDPSVTSHSIHGPYSGDQAFNANLDVRRLSEQNPKLSGRDADTLKQGARPNPCNRIWDTESTGLSKALDKGHAFAKVKVSLGSIMSGEPLPPKIVKEIREAMYEEKEIYLTL